LNDELGGLVLFMLMEKHFPSFSHRYQPTPKMEESPTTTLNNSNKNNNNNLHNISCWLTQ